MDPDERNEMKTSLGIWGSATCRPASTRPSTTRADGDVHGGGFGRVNGAEAIDSYLQTKSVWTELSDEVSDPFVMRV